MVEIRSKPSRIHTLSVGLDEITLRIAEPSRIIAVGRATANPAFSNVAAEASRIDHQIDRNAAAIIPLQPDLVVASPFARPELLAELQAAGVPLVVADLVDSSRGHAANIQLLGYLYGEKARADALVAHIRRQIAHLARLVEARALSPRPRVLVVAGTSAAGGGTNENGVVLLAGARNAAEDAGIVGHRAVSLKWIATLDPDAVVATEPDPSDPTLSAPVLRHPSLAGLRAVREGRVIRIKASLVNTLSHWSVVGAAELARSLYGAAAPPSST